MASWDRWLLRACVRLCVLLCDGDVLGASLQRLMVQMDDLNGGVYLFCGAATWGDLLFPGVAEFFTLLHIPGTIFHPRTPNPQTDLFSDPACTYILPLSNTCTHAAADSYTHANAGEEHKHTFLKNQTWEHTQNTLLYLFPWGYLAITLFYLLLCLALQAFLWWDYNCSHIFLNCSSITCKETKICDHIKVQLGRIAIILNIARICFKLP